MGVRFRQDPKDQCWYVHVTHQNRRKARKVGPGKEGERNAHKPADVTRGEIALGTFKWWAEEKKVAAKDNPTLKEYSARWLKMAVVTKLKVGTQEKYEEAMRKHWLLSLSNVRVRELSRDQIKLVLEAKSVRYSMSLLLFVVSVLRACLNTAIEDKLILVNPAERLGKLIGGRPREPITIFEPATLAHLLTTCSLKLPHLYPTVLILARTGMHLGEALTLQVGDLDLPRHRAWVRRTWGSRRAAVGHARINTPKNGKARQVDLSDQLTDVLRGYLQVHKRKPSAWLFPSSETDMPWHLDTFRHQWHLLLKEAKLPYQHPHTLRHSYASVLQQNGGNLEYVMRQLGHASIKITVDTYGHLVPSLDRRAVNQLDEICK